MSQEDVGIVRESWEAWLRGDMDGVLANYAPDVVWDLTHFREWPDAVYEGPSGVRQFLGEWLDVWDDFEVGVDEFRVAPDGRIVALAWQRGRGRHSGLAMDMKWAMITTVRDGQIIYMDNYDDRRKALEAAGLTE
jgi:ketosteroid isomerase-like protein